MVRVTILCALVCRSRDDRWLVWLRGTDRGCSRMRYDGLVVELARQIFRGRGLARKKGNIDLLIAWNFEKYVLLGKNQRIYQV